MAAEKIHDYLAKQLSIENAVVTFRLLSREMEIHVNAAQQALENYKNDNNPIYTTYLITGTLPPHQRTYSQDENGMDIDGSGYEEYDWDPDWDDDDSVQETQIVLVGQDNLENVKSEFTNIHSIHVYSLSHARLLDEYFVCPPTETVRKIDISKGPEFALGIGKIIGPNVAQRKTNPAAKGKGKAPVAPVVASSKIKAEPKEERREQEVSKTSEKDTKISAGGKLDWSKAKSKDDVKKERQTKRKEEEEKEKQQKEKENKAKNERVQKEKQKERENMEAEPPKRGVKRKSEVHILSESEEEEEPAPTIVTKNGSKKVLSKEPVIRKGVILSDEDEEPKPVKNKGKAKSRTEETETEKKLRAMMDIDDDEVEKVTAATRANLHMKEEEGEEEEDREAAGETINDEPASEPELIKPKPRKRKEKKIIPVGKNGLKKKKILKSRTRIDDKGYMVTEDYSSYESVNEEEPEPEPPKKKATTKSKESSSKETIKKSGSIGNTSSKTKVSDGGSSKSNKNLMNFFGKKQ